MAYGIILEFENVGKSHYDAVNGKLGLDVATGTGDWPEGLRSHAGGTTSANGFCVFEIWDTKEQQEAFMSGRLGAALATVGVPAPSRVTEVDLVGVHIP